MRDLLDTGGRGRARDLWAYDGNGNQVSQGTAPAGQVPTSFTTYGWDDDNRLASVVFPDGTASSFEYDANGLRTKKVEGGVVTRFVLDGASVFEELDSVGNTTTSYLTNPQVIDEILSFQTGGATYFPLTDALGSVVAVTDSSGAVVRTNSYDVYGARTTAGSGPNIAFGFTGREYDSTGLNYHRDRYMDPTTGRWGQPDRLGMIDGPNLYQYVKSNPAAFVDPRGRSYDREFGPRKNVRGCRLGGEGRAVGVDPRAGGSCGERGGHDRVRETCTSLPRPLWRS